AACAVTAFRRALYWAGSSVVSGGGAGGTNPLSRSARIRLTSAMMSAGEMNWWVCPSTYRAVRASSKLTQPSRAAHASGVSVLNFWAGQDRKSTRLNSSHVKTSYAVFCLKKKKHNAQRE